MYCLCYRLVGVLLLQLHIMSQVVEAIRPPVHPKSVPVRNGRCIYRGRSITEAYITQADGKCVQVLCKPRKKLVYFNPMKECMLTEPGAGCFYMDGLLENVCCKPSIACE